MWRKTMGLGAVLTVLVLVPGCSDELSDSLGNNGGDASATELADLALQSDLLTEELVSAELDAMNVDMAATTEGGAGDDGAEIVTDERTFSRTRSCPGGGVLAVEGTLLRTFDPATGVMEAESAGSRTRTDCTFSHGPMSITVNGIAEWEKFRRRVNGLPDGLQTSHYYGSSTAVRSDGTERSCEFDFTVIRDPETHTRTVDGTMCGGRIRHGVSWSPHP
jgi:hypothetical protein